MNESDFKERLLAAAREREEPFSESLHARVMETIRTDKQTETCPPRVASLLGRVSIAAVLLLVLGIAGWNLRQMPIVQEEIPDVQTCVVVEEKPARELVETLCPWKSTVETTAEIVGVKDSIQFVALGGEQLPLPSRQTVEEVWHDSADFCAIPVAWLLE